jgi:hypothetical protein
MFDEINNADNKKLNETTVESADAFFKTFGDKLNAAFSSMIDVSFPTLIKEIQRLDVEATKVTALFGQGRENIQQIKAAMADASAEVLGLGGSYEDVTKIQMAAAKDLQRNVILGGDVYKDIYAATQVTAQGAEKLLPAFKNVGVSAYGVADGMQKIVNVAREQGLSVQAVSEQAVTNMESMNKYNFQGGVDGLAKMAAQASSMRIDMKTTLNFAEGLYNPEKAIEMSSALQRLGVTQSDLLDPLRLMDLSLNDPTELQNQLVQMTEQFVQLNEKGQFEIAPQGKLQLREISKATGLAYEELTKMAMGSAELEDKMRKIKFPDFMSEEQQKMVANLAEMKDGQYVITVDGQTKPIAEALEGINNEEQLDELIGKSEPKTMEDLAFEQLDMQKSMAASLKKLEGRAARGIASTKLTDDLINVSTKTTRAGTDVLTSGGALGTAEIRGLVDNLSEPLKDMFGKMQEGNFDFSLEGDKFLTAIGEAVKNQEGIIGENVGTFEKFMSQYGMGMSEELEKNIEKITGVDITTQQAQAVGVETGEVPPAGTTPKADATLQGGESKMDININVTAPPGMSQQQIMDALNIQEIKEKIYKIYEDMNKDFKKKS